MKSTALWAVLLAVVAPDGQKIVIEHFAEPGGMNRAVFLSKGEGILRVVTGGALASGADKGEAFLADLLESSGLDAIAVGYEDLAAGDPDRRALLGSAKIPFICANVKGAGRPYVVKAIGGTKVALVGVTRIPASRKDFALAPGWSIENPAAALKAILPALAREAELVVLVAVMDRVECAALLKEVPGIHAALAPGAAGSDPEPLKSGETWIVQSSAHPSVFSRTMLDVDAKKLTGATNRLETAELSEADRGRLTALFAKHKEGVDLATMTAGVAIAPPAGAVKETGPLTALETGKVQPVVVRRSDGTVEIVVESVRVAGALGDRKAPAGSVWLVIESAWKNLIPMSRVGARELPTVYSVGDAENNLYVVVNGARLSRLDAGLSAGDGGLLTGRSVSVEKYGAVRRGRLVFPIPAAGVESLALHFLDFRHPPALFPLLGVAGKGVEKPWVPAVRNEVLEVALFGMERAAAVGGRKAPEGMTFVLVDFRARSVVTLETPEGPVGVAGDLARMVKLIALQDDGGRISPVEAESELLESPRFLPNVLTGGRLAFLAPEKASGFRLVVGFDEIALPDGKTVKPKPMTFVLDPAARACPKCGERAGAADKFCGKCGTPLGR